MKKRLAGRTVREPVQVYLEPADKAMLDRTALASGLSRAEVLRRGLRSIAGELLADESPALSFLEMSSSVPRPEVPRDVAERHDAYLADSEMASWGQARRSKKAKPARK